METKVDVPRLIKGGVAVDDRGTVSFCNDFNLLDAGIKRFYVLKNHWFGYVRAWHGHKIEAKYIAVVSGIAIVAAAQMDDKAVSFEDAPHRFILSANDGDVLYVPPGWANGHRNLAMNTHVIHFSTTTLEESKNDDYRFDARVHGDVWEVESR